MITPELADRIERQAAYLAKGLQHNGLACSFCGKRQDEVRYLIAGPCVFICDECVELCYAIIHEKDEALTPPGYLL